MIDWVKAAEVVFNGLGGVFVVLIILQLCINIFSKAVNLFTKKEVGEQKS